MQYVYVLNKHGEPLMPCSPGKARLLLKQQKACVVKRTPFTIKLLFGSAGYKHKVLYKGQECFVSGRRSSGTLRLKSWMVRASLKA